LVARLRHGTGLPPSRARAEAPSVALPADALAPEEPARPLLPRRLRKGLSERKHRLDAPRPGEGSRKRLQAHLDRPRLPDRPRRPARARPRATRALVRRRAKSARVQKAG